MDSERLLNGGGTELERSLLRGAMEEQPPEELVLKMRQALRIVDVRPWPEASDLVTGVRHVQPTRAGAQGAGAWANKAVLAGGAAVAAGIVGLSAMLLSSRGSSPRDEAAAPLAIPVALPAPVLGAAPEGLAAVEPRPVLPAVIEIADVPSGARQAPAPLKPTADVAMSAVTVVGRAPSGGKLSRTAQLGLEVQALEGVRSALEGGRTDDARHGLKKYRLRFKKPILGHEASVLAKKVEQGALDLDR